MIKKGKKYRYDDEFEGKRLVDKLTALENQGKRRKVLVYSPRLRANILVYASRLEKVV